jgi:hypothetical protein
MSLGGAGHAGPILTDSIYLNPSFGSFTPKYSIGVTYEWFNGETLPGQSEPDYRGKVLNASIQDGRSELFQAGVGYTIRPDARFVHVGASKAIVMQFGVGLGGKFVFPSDSSQSQIRDLNLSMTGIPFGWAHATLFADNLLESADSRSRGMYREIVLGTKFNIRQILLLYIDPHWAPNAPEGTTWGYQAGAEAAAFSDVLFRGGVFHNAMIPFEGRRGDGYGFGGGWVAPRISFDYGFQVARSPVKATSHGIAMTIHF